MQKQLLAVFFYFTYLLAMFQPLFPLIDYYANYDYIAQELCENKDRPYLECNGKCYVKKQVQENTTDSHNHQSTIPKIDFSKNPVLPIEEIKYPIATVSNESTLIRFSKNITHQEYYTLLLRPPQVIS